MTFSPDQFRSRGLALEAAFFQKRDAELLAKIRSGLAAMEEKKGLSDVSGILDENVLLDLMRAGVTGESLLAMRFVPMIVVAWSDRVISPEEHAAILSAAEADNVIPGTPAHQLLHSWLERRPDNAVIVAWKAYVSELAHIMPPESLKKLRERTETLCHRVAKAAGGVLGFGRISPAEQAAIDDFMNSWKHA